MDDYLPAARAVVPNVLNFAENGSGIKLRAYQQTVAEAVVKSVRDQLGYSFVVIFPRQSGKNELQANIESYLLVMLRRGNAELVKVSPTWKPQAMNAMRRLERVLKKNIVTTFAWKREQGYIYSIDGAKIYFMSGAPTSNIVGQTANALLECDEAQDVTIEKWDKDCAPMAASTNATRVFWGTAWTSDTLLAREMRAALAAQKEDGIQRVFIIDANEVRKEVPAYGKYVDAEVAKHGRNHPYVKTQYFCEELDGTGGMFPPERISLIEGLHAHQNEPRPGSLYAFCLDIAGSDENSTQMGNLTTNRDSTALTIYEIILPNATDIFPGPTFNIVHRRTWTGISQASLYRHIHALADRWRPHRIIIDATGVGEGMSSFLNKSYPNQVIPFKFSQASKSDLGWKLLSAIETGHLKDFARLPENTVQLSDLTVDQAALQQRFYQQLTKCTLEILPGPGKFIRWSVPDSARTPAGELIHDDLLLSAALIACLLESEGLGATESAIVTAYDPISQMTY